MLIQDRESFITAKTVLIDADVIAIDTETVFTDRRDERILIGLSTYCKVKGREDFETGFYFPFRHTHNMQLFQTVENLPTEWLRELAVPLGRRDYTALFHNAKFDMQILRKEGIDIVAPFYDTMIMSYMVDENSTHALKPLAKSLFAEDADEEQKLVKRLTKQLGSWEAIPPDVMGIYAVKDTQLTYRLWGHLMPQLKQQELDGLWEDEAEFSRCLLQMEETGLRIDSGKALELAWKSETRMQAIRETLGFDPAKPAQLARKLYAQQPDGLGLLPLALGKNSLPQPITLSNGKTMTAIPVMDKHTLGNYSHEVVDLVLEYRGLMKAKSTWFDGFLAHVCEDGRIHPNFKQHGTKTTRLSCSEPNVQQIPRTSEEEVELGGFGKEHVKKLFLADSEYQLWEFDYSQVEFRLAAVYADERVLIDGYAAGRDFHTITAEQLGISRQDAKTINFAILYGAGPTKLTEQLKISLSEARSVLSAFQGAYPSLHQTAVQAERAAERGWIRYWTGRRRHFQYPSEYHKAFNSVIQGGAAEIMKQTMLRVYRCDTLQSKLVSQVHDALWFEVPVERLDKEVKQIRELMEWPSEQFSVAFPVEAKKLN